MLVSVLASDWSDSLQSHWPEVGRKGAFMIRESDDGDGWSAFVGDRSMITATSRGLLEEGLSRVDDNQAKLPSSVTPPLMRNGESQTAIWVTRRFGDVSITATWEKGASSVSAIIEGDGRQSVAFEFATELNAVVADKTEAWLRVAIPVGIDQGALHPFVVMEGLFGKWPVH